MRATLILNKDLTDERITTASSSHRTSIGKATEESQNESNNNNNVRVERIIELAVKKAVQVSLEAMKKKVGGNGAEARVKRDC